MYTGIEGVGVLHSFRAGIWSLWLFVFEVGHQARILSYLPLASNEQALRVLLKLNRWYFACIFASML